jgi:hypothetical protein
MLSLPQALPVFKFFSTSLISSSVTLMSIILLFALKSGVLHGHSSVYQLIEIDEKVCNNLDNRLSNILIFCGISKAFDRVWHRGLIERLKSCVVSGEIM